MRNFLIGIYWVLSFYLFGGSLYAQELIQIDDDIFMHPAKNILEVRGISQEDLLNLTFDDMALCQRLSELFKDDFDVYVFVWNLEGNETSLGGYTAVLSNQIQGIGEPIYSCDLLPSKQRLMGCINLTGLRCLFTGPFLHEICHLYGAPDLGQVEVDAEGNEIGTGGHWGISDINGQLGGFDSATLSVSGDNYQASSWISTFFNEDFNGFNPEGISHWRYAPLELYLMGLAPINEVPDVHIYRGLSNTNYAKIYKYGSFTAKEVITYTQDDLIRKWGVRVPDYKDSPKELSILPVILTNKPLTDSQWSLVQEDIAMQELKGDTGPKGATGREWPMNFWEATQGRGTIKISGIDKSLYKSVTGIETIKEHKLCIVDGYVCSEKEIVEVKGYDWSGRFLENVVLSAYKVNLSQLKGNVLLFRFADGSVEAIKRHF